MSEERLNCGELRCEFGATCLLIRSAILDSSSVFYLYTNILVLLFYVLATCLNMFYQSSLRLGPECIVTIGDVSELGAPGFSSAILRFCCLLS